MKTLICEQTLHQKAAQDQVKPYAKPHAQLNARPQPRAHVTSQSAVALKQANPRTVQLRLKHELDLLCGAGVGLAPIARRACELIRELVGAECASIFWLDERGMPEGFFHENANPQAQDLLMNHFERLFMGENETTVFHLAQRTDGRVGHFLNPTAAHYASNVFNLLVKPCGHHHVLDLRVDRDGRGRAVVLLFRPQSQPFTEQDATALNWLAPYLERAIAQVSPLAQWVLDPTQTGHLIVAGGGEQLHLRCPQAEALLRQSLLVGQGIDLLKPLAGPPGFVKKLCHDFLLSGSAHRSVSLDVPNGRLKATASRMLTGPALSAPAPSEGGALGQSPAKSQRQSGASCMPECHVLVTLEFFKPARLQVVRGVVGLDLSPLQREIALLAGLGGLRQDCERVIGVSKEALKKHLKSIYCAAGVDNWDSLARSLSPFGSAVYA
jgi:hypothetical protein